MLPRRVPRSGRRACNRLPLDWQVNIQTEWRWADPAGQQRLVREDELRAAIATGVIPANAPVWTRGWKEWKPAHDVPELTRPAPATPSNGDVPPPPPFVVAAQNAFEGKPAPVPTGPAEPPPPPRYVPIAAKTVPNPVDSVTQVDAPKPIPKRVATPPPLSKTAVMAAKPTPSIPNKTPPPLPAKAKSSRPPPLPAKAASAKPPVVAPVAPNPKPAPLPQQSPYKQTQRPPMGVAPPSEELSPPSGRATFHVAVAPPPLPKIELQPTPTVQVARAPEPPLPVSKHPTLMMFEPSEPSEAQPIAKPESSAPIVVPPNEPSARINAVTKPPPWGEGAVGMDAGIPKAPGLPNVTPDERQSQAPRPVELSSSDLTSEAQIATAAVKAAPLAPAERTHGTMHGLGPDVLQENRAVLDRAVNLPPPAPTPPLSQSDMATNKWAPLASTSAAKIHDIKNLTQERVQRTVARLKEQTKDKPPWVLPVVAASGGVVVFILLAVIVKTAIGAIAGSSPSTSASASASAPSTISSSPITASSGKAPPSRPMRCTVAEGARTIAPRALVSSGVEVATIGGQFALGFAAAPKEAAVEVLNPTTLSSLTNLRLRADPPIRRVLALDAARAAVDSDHKGDALQGRRTFAASPPIDVGAMDGGIAWTPHGSDKGIKLWALAKPDARIEALRGEALGDGSGFAIAFRQGTTIWFGAFGGTPPAPLGALGHVDGLGPQVGSPAIATSGDRVMVAWADRTGSDTPWGIRYATFTPGKDEPVSPKTLTPPPGGLGADVMSPGLASLDGGRFLFLWTEGPKSDHQVRAATVGRDDAIADAFIASAEGVNAGQAQAAVLPNGKGVVAFLAASTTGKGFEVAATSITCAEK